LCFIAVVESAIVQIVVGFSLRRVFRGAGRDASSFVTTDLNVETLIPACAAEVTKQVSTWRARFVNLSISFGRAHPVVDA
jgi:hypothetical protein